MSTSTSRLSYSDCFELMDRALEDPRGVRVKFPDEGGANYFRLRLHSARKIDRQDNCEIYPKDHPMYGQSPYDQLIARKRYEAPFWWLYIEHDNVCGHLEIEDLGELKTQDELSEIVDSVQPVRRL